jgi:hypothetical protein
MFKDMSISEEQMREYKSGDPRKRKSKAVAAA